jgi:hypothetical protein
MAPSPNTSQRSSSRSTSPAACCGAMHAGVPSTEPACELSPADPLRTVAMAVTSPGPGSAAAASRRPRTLASPQSMTWTSPKAPTMTLAGLRSRWITPRLWA